MINYDAKSIKALDDISHIRLRPALYIGNLSVTNHLIYEIIDNSIDEFLAGFGSSINVRIYKDCSVRIRDYGRGIPIGITKDKNNNDINSLTLIVGTLNSGGKYDNNVYQYSAGLHGQGCCCVNALSDFFVVTVYRDGNIYQQKFEKGLPVTDVAVIGQTEETGTEIYYKPDKEIFTYTLKPDNDVRNRLQELAALNSGLVINYVNDLSNMSEIFHYPQGLVDYLQQLVTDKKLLFPQPIHIKNEDNTVEIVFLINKELESLSFIKSFCNNINNHEGGTHVTASIKSLIENFNNWGIKNKLFKTPIEQKYYLENMFLIINVKMLNPSFEGQTKIKLNSIEIEPIITDTVNNFFKKQSKVEEFKQFALLFLNFVIQIKEADEAAKKARIEKRINNKVTKKQVLPAQLSDCINAGTNKYAELLLTEGQSASGCISSQTGISLADGREVLIVDLVKEFNEGKKNYVFCCDEKGNIHIRPILKAFQTKFAEKLYRITLDNDLYLDCTPEHLIMMRNGTYKSASELCINDSIMPLYRDIVERERTFYDDTYKMPIVKQNSNGIYKPLYKIVAQEYLGPREKGVNTHHVDFDPCNNNPENLVYLSPQEHTQLHATAQKYWEDLTIKEKIGQKSKENWQDPEYRKKLDFVFHAETNPLVIAHRKRMKEDEEYKQEVVARFMKYREENPDWKEHLSEKMNEFYDVNTEKGREHRKKASDKSKEQWDDEELRKWRAEETKKQIQQQRLNGTFDQIQEKAHQTTKANRLKHTVALLKEMIANNIAINRPNYDQQREIYIQANNINVHRVLQWNSMRQVINFNARKDDVEKIIKEYIENFNHKVINIEIIDYNDYVYDLEIEEFHNFAISAGIFIHNSAVSGRISSEIQAILPLRGKVLNVEKASWEQIINSPSIQRIIQSLGTGFGNNFDIDKLRYKKVIILCLKGDTRVKMLDGTIRTFIELVEMEEQNPNQDYWVYSCKPDGTIVPGKMKHPRITQYVQDTIKVTLDDGGFLEVTIDHQFMLRDGTYCEAQNLKIGDSLMPLYTRTHTQWSAGREELYNNAKNVWERTHRVVIQNINNIHSGRNWHVHHINENYLDNRPDNLEWRSQSEHAKMHVDNIIQYNQSQEHRDRVKQLHQEGVYKHTYWGNNGYNGSEAQKKMLKELNQREDIKKKKSEIITAYNKTKQNAESTAKINQREDVKLLQKQGKIVHLLACLIRKHISFKEQDFVDKTKIEKLKEHVINVPTLAKIKEVFNSFDDALQQATEYEKEKLTDDMFKQLTNVGDVKQNRIASNINTKRNSMAKIGKQVLDQGLEFNETNYMKIKADNKSKAPRWENWNQYFETIDELIETSKNYNHKVINIAHIHYDEPIPMYCGTVEDHHNFAVVTSEKDNNISGIIVRNCDADTDGLHIKSLLTLLMYKYMRQIITEGHLYAAIPPLYRVIYNKNQSLYLKDDEALEQWKKQNPNITNYEVQRFKG